MAVPPRRASWGFAKSRGLLFVVLLGVLPHQTFASEAVGGLEAQAPALERTVDLDRGETAVVTLADGGKATVKLVTLEEKRDALRQAVREACVRVELNGQTLTLTSALYHLPVTAGGVQIDCPVTRGYAQPVGQDNQWAIRKDARFRLWPAGSPWTQPGTFGYPARQRWFANDTQMANEPVFVDGGEMPGESRIYYHYGVDFGGAEGLVEVVAATDGLVVSAADVTLPGHANSPAKARYDVIYVLDGRGWYYRYSHLQTIDVKPGQRVSLGQRLGLLGKEGGSGGWAHLHFDITSRQPSGEWGIQDAYAYVWEAWQRQTRPMLVAVARPHRLASVGDTLALDATRSWSRTGRIARYEWTFGDGTSASGPVVERRYLKPGAYSERLKVMDERGDTSWDFAVVQVVDPFATNQVPPTIHAAYYPTDGIRAGDEVTFKVRTFRTQHGAETWDFGDGTPPVKVQSDGNKEVHARDGYAVTTHRFARAGHYFPRVERANERGERATAQLHIEVGEGSRPAGSAGKPR